MRGRQASRDTMEVGLERKALVVRLWTLCQKVFMPRRALELGVKKMTIYFDKGSREGSPGWESSSV